MPKFHIDDLTPVDPKSEQTDLSALFAAEPSRPATFSVTTPDLHLDYSRQRLTQTLRDQLLSRAEQSGVLAKMHRMVAGDEINATEGRAVLHTACRGTACEDADIMAEIAATDARLKSFVDELHSSAGIDTVIAIGIGGSELGPALAVDALQDAYPSRCAVRFCANIDGIAFQRATRELDPKRTLILIVSKSFGTLETKLNAERAKSWMQASLGDAWSANVAIVSANLEATAEFGVPDAQVFPMWDFIGGRYSVWSAVGLPIALAYGWDVFRAFRDGAKVMDTHMLTAAPSDNMPLVMALMTVWNTGALWYQAEAVVPYDTRLNLFVSHLQQLMMESNGKGVTQGGVPVSQPTQPVVFGGVGTNAQHAFFQQLHQGTTAAPVDILVPARPRGVAEDLFANAFAQADALAFGDQNAADPHKDYPGNRPSNVLLYRDLDARVLGQLIALYEHKTALAAALWDINAFDQWGVELGKRLSADMRAKLDAPEDTTPLIVALHRLQEIS
jgi:glucose-6-phosphate isomerase